MMLRYCAVAAAGLTLAACSASPAQVLRSADAAAANAQCRTTPQPGGGSSTNCTLWERGTTTTTTTTVGPNGESVTTVERTQTGDEAQRS
ncbi:MULTISPECIES: hypothetical protein [Brevundimonas]|jgi:hypothetical protein|uniref:hypothetical protein n=1 Tax=Brevundimonas TaxID=41275 RepID=UPI001A18B2D0|nr:MULTISPECIES: hypothetical protein [Brevundimonas]MBK1970117.1 hypothetical protein [Brevundimonas diminuta]MDM8354208.1 hypothetical protein [Brevundimonas diminuta]